jgi:hypothetical protein
MSVGFFRPFTSGEVCGGADGLGWVCGNGSYWEERVLQTFGIGDLNPSGFFLYLSYSDDSA